MLPLGWFANGLIGALHLEEDCRLWMSSPTGCTSRRINEYLEEIERVFGASAILRKELQGMKPGALKRRARELGISEESLGEVDV